MDQDRYVGRRVRRLEDPRLLRGEGVYVADLHLPGMAYLAVLRSPHAHARITRLDLGPARNQPGVLLALGLADLAPQPPKLPVMMAHPALHTQAPYPLAADRVRHVGEAVALVVAEDPYLAEDALEAIQVDYAALPAVVDAAAALDPAAARLHPDMDSNLAARVVQRLGDVDAAFAAADVTLHYAVRFGRLSGQPLETRGVVATWTRTVHGPHLTVWASTQAPHLVRNALGQMLGLPTHAIRVVAPDVGGGFGTKGRFYPEEYLVPCAARRLARPVCWIEDRRENLLAAAHAREQVHQVAVAARRDGTLLGLRDRFLVDIGAYSPSGIVAPHNGITQVVGGYHLPSAEIEMQAVYTNKSPMAPYRAAGRPPAVFVIEKAMDLLARELSLDPAAVRLRNFIQPGEFPYRVGLVERDGSEVTYDSGDYPAGLRLALALVDRERFRAEQAAARRAGRYLGLGIGCYVESTGRGPYEGATVRVEPSGRVVVATGAVPQGQAHATILAQLCADRLGVTLDDVTVITGDTDRIGLGIGTFASRTAVVAGSAVSAAARQVRAKALQVAAQLLEADAADLELTQGDITVRGTPERRLALSRVAELLAAPPASFVFPAGLEPGLEATHYFHPTGNTYASGVHVAVVEVDVETGAVRVVRYVVVHDCGKVINPLVLDGQVHGGVGQGLGNALWEELHYDAAGQVLTTSYLDYLLPTADTVPPMVIGHVETPTPLNPEGIKGAGEGGTMPAPAAIASAVEDALAPWPIHIERIPIRPADLLEQIDAARAAVKGGPPTA